jgi:hypothetical protein
VLSGTAAAMIGCSPSTVLRLADDSELKSWRFRPNGWRHIEIASIERYVKRTRNGRGALRNKMADRIVNGRNVVTVGTAARILGRSVSTVNRYWERVRSRASRAPIPGSIFITIQCLPCATPSSKTQRRSRLLFASKHGY